MHSDFFIDVMLSCVSRLKTASTLTNFRGVAKL
jgi:hypothetical protein